MDGLDPSAVQAVSGWVLLIVLVVVRELASGALKQAGEELWRAIKRRKSRAASRDVQIQNGSLT